VSKSSEDSDDSDYTDKQSGKYTFDRDGKDFCLNSEKTSDINKAIDHLRTHNILDENNLYSPLTPQFNKPPGRAGERSQSSSKSDKSLEYLRLKEGR